MHWFKGTISEAIVTSRQKKRLFVVVVTGEDEASNQLVERLNDLEVSNLFKNSVCISLKNGSIEANQFSQVYPVLVVPAVYVIGIQGVPLEVITGAVDKEQLLSRTMKALDSHNKEVSPQTVEVAAVPEARPSEAKLNETVPSEEGAASQEALPLEARVEKANQLLAAVRAKKAEEEREKEKAKERERREMGKQLQKLKETQEQRELKELAESRQKEKREEREAREKIRQQIAQDRAERAAKYQAAKESEEERKRAAQSAQEQLQQERASAARSAFARIQFRLPDGSNRNEQFSSDLKLSDVKSYIDDKIKPPFSPYMLCTTFPRREFDSSHMSMTLRDLDLSPSAVLLIIPKAKQPKSEVSWFDKLLAPFIWVWTLLTGFLFAAPAIDRVPVAPTDSQPTNEGGVRRRRPGSNIRRVGDEFSDDDNATWNGNSTQQL